MRTRIVHKVIFGGIAAGFLALPLVLLLAPGAAVGTPESMQLLPAYSKYQCLICHASASPTVGSAELNAFGTDFVANGKAWNRTLADMNSDGDRCLNGFELGDQNGDGVFDGSGQIIENANPGNPNDCTIALTEATWGIIKDIFSQELREYIDDSEVDSLYEFSVYFP